MAENYFGAPNPFLAGMDYNAARRMRGLRENALNALIARYGPEAADPASYAALQGIEQRADLHPYNVSQAQRVDAARSAEVQARGPMAGDPAVQQRDEAAKLQAAQRAAAVLEMVKAQGGDLGQAFDFVSAALPAIGVPPEHIGAIRQQIVEDPDAVDELVAMLRDPQQVAANRAMSGGQPFYDDRTGKLVWGIPTASGELRVVPGYTPAMAAQGEVRLGQGQQRLGLQARALSNEEARMRGFDAPTGMQLWELEDGRIVADPIPGSQQDAERQEERDKQMAAARAAIRANTGVLTAGTTVLRDGERAIDRLDNLGRAIRGDNMLSSFSRVMLSRVWGTEARRLQANIQSVMDNIGIDKLLEIKALGSGLGQVPHQQLITLQSMLGRLNDLDRPVDELRQDMQDVLKRYNEIIEGAKKEIVEAEAFLARPVGSFGPQPRPTPPTQTGGATDLSNASDEDLLRILSGGR